MKNRQPKFIVEAAKTGDIAAVKRFLAKGVSIEECPPSGTPLMVAAAYGQLAMAKFLISRGADPNHRDLTSSPLERAVSRGQLAMVKFLLRKGAKIGGGVFGGLPLFEAVFNGYRDIVKELIAAGADVNQREVIRRTDPRTGKWFISSRGGTVLMIAVRLQEVDIAGMLIAAGANPGVKDVNGKTALDYARKTKNAELIKLLSAAPKRRYKVPVKRASVSAITRFKAHLAKHPNDWFSPGND